MNIRLDLSYDGSAYHGWQRQANAMTVQEKLELAIKRITGEDSSVTGCSRTDAGVHAYHYVCNFFSDTRIPSENLPLALNTALPEDIRVKKAHIIDNEFHSRFSAKSKTYVYKIWNSRIADPFLSGYSYHFPQILDVDAMKKGAAFLVGEHDFTAFMAAGGQQKTTVRMVNSLEVSVAEKEISIEINANAYLYNMVRIIAGTLVYVGFGRLKADDIPGVIKSKSRVEAGITAPAQGLYLKEVLY